MPWGAGINRSATHLSLLALYALGGYLVNNKLLPVGVLVTAIGFTFSLVFATQVGAVRGWLGEWLAGPH
jgi:ATP-binding cassette subfamily B (MDR/TAP) protein 8